MQLEPDLPFNILIAILSGVPRRIMNGSGHVVATVLPHSTRVLPSEVKVVRVLGIVVANDTSKRRWDMLNQLLYRRYPRQLLWYSISRWHRIITSHAGTADSCSRYVTSIRLRVEWVLRSNLYGGRRNWNSTWSSNIHGQIFSGCTSGSTNDYKATE